MQFHRRPIELSFFERGPGPAQYELPGLTGKKDHDVTHLIEPAYSFGLKLPPSFLPQHYVSPGPGSYLFPERCTRRGIGASPAFSIKAKFPLVEGTVTPAPNYYRTVGTNVFKVKVPSFTMPVKRKQRTKMSKLAPNKYETTPMFGPYVPTRIAAPAITLKGKPKTKELPMNDNAVYDISKPLSGPAFTIRQKPQEFKSHLNKAGPASYKIERAKIFPRAPKWSMGIRYNEFTKVPRTECDNLDTATLNNAWYN